MAELSINIDELAFVLHRGSELELECYLNLETGDIINIPTDNDILTSILKLEKNINVLDKEALIRKIAPDSTNFLYIPNNFPNIIFDLMSEFTRSIENEYQELHDKLWVAIQKEGGYQEFHRMIKSEQGLLKKFLLLRDSFFEASALQWLRDNEIKVVTAKATL